MTLCAILADEHLAVGLLHRIMRAGRLDFRLACVFREAGHESLREAIEALDLVSAIPTHNTITRFKTLFRLAPPPHWHYCSPGRCACAVEVPE